MDLNGNGSGEQRDRSEESLANASNEEKIPQLGNGVKRDEGIDPIRSNDSLKNAAARNFDRNQQYRRTCQRRENYAKMCEHRRDSVYQGNFPDGNTVNFAEGNIWDGGEPEQRCDNYGDGNGAMECDVNGANDPFSVCKSGINISVVSQRQPNCELVELEKPVYTVSFKRCYDRNDSKSDSKRRIFPTSCSRSKKRKKEARRDERRPGESAGGSSNFRCTFENCCGNCEPYVMEIRNDDCDSYENWKNSHFGSKKECFEDCFCPRDAKDYSSNASVHPHETCMVCDDGQKPDLQPSDSHSSNKNCLQRVHFAKAENCPKTEHSSCSFCSRKCTPSKASLFVEIGESVANVLNLTSTQAFACDGPMEALKDETRKKEYGGLKSKKSSLLRSRCGSKKSETRCSPSCKGRQDAVQPYYSDRIDCMNIDDCSIEVPREAFCPEMLRNAASTTFQDCEAKMESDTHARRKTTGCSQQCEMNERSLFGDIRKAKIWSQIQDTYKCFMRTATASIGQLVKQSSKLKRSKKGTRDCSTYGTCAPIGEENIPCLNPCNQSQTCTDCVHGEACWQEIHCCRNVCCESIAGLPDCQTPICQSDYWNGQGQVQSGNDWLLEAYSCEEISPKKLRREKFGKGRKKGGGEPLDQKKKQTNSSKRPNLNPGDHSNAPNNRGNTGSRGQVTNQPLNTGKKRSVQNYSPKSPRSEVSSRSGTSNPRREMSQKSATKQDSDYTRLTMRNQAVQCSIIDRNEIVCHSGVKDPSLVADQCICALRTGTALTEAIERPDETSYMTMAALDDISMIGRHGDSEKTIIEEPTNWDTTKDSTVPGTDETTTDATRGTQNVVEPSERTVTVMEKTADKSSGVPASAEIASTETYLSAVNEETSKNTTTVATVHSTQPPVIPESTMPESTIPESTIECTEPSDMAEISKDFNGKRVAVSVEMQTSNTILTQILSEFQIGNKKRQVLMSIKLHSEWCNGDEKQPSESSSTEEGETINGPSDPDDETESSVQESTKAPRYEDSIFGHRKRMQQTQQTEESMRPITGCGICGKRLQESSVPSPIREVATSTGRRHNLCIGPCGKLMR